MSDLELSVCVRSPGTQVHFADEKQCVHARGTTVFLTVQGRRAYSRKIRIEGRIADCLARSSWPSRLMRKGVHWARPWKRGDSTELLVFCNKRLYRIGEEPPREIFSLRRGRRPLRSGICQVEGQIYVGDYWGNPERKSVAIRAVNLENGECQTVFQFSAGKVRHIHALRWDPFARKIWFSTGDEDSECMIGVFDPEDWSRYEVVGSGSQLWRTLDFVFEPERVVWGTDDHLTLQNRILCYSRPSCELEEVGQVRGPVYYSKPLKDYLVFGTAAERRLHDGLCMGALTALVRKSGELFTLTSASRRSWEPPWVGYGVWEFADGEEDGNSFWVAAKGFEGGLASYRMEIEERDSSND